MWRSPPALKACLLGVLALAWNAQEARAQGRIPNFPRGIALPDASGRNAVEWLGADSAFGSYIGVDLSFWAFGDTYLGSPGVPGRQLSNVVANTIAIGQIVNGNFTPRYFYRGTAGKKQAFFPDPGPVHKYWPHASVVIDGKLYVFLSLIYTNPNAGIDDPAGSVDTGTVVARVNNPLDVPTNWQIEYISLHLENPGRQAILKLGIEAVMAPGPKGVILYGFYTNAKTNSYKAVVTMVSFAGLRDAPDGKWVEPSQVQYLAADASNANPRWKPGFGMVDERTDDYLDTKIDSVSGFTVRWNSLLAKWQVVGASSQYAAKYPYPRGNPFTPRPSARIFVAPTPFGPFLNAPDASDCYFFNFPELNSRDETLWVYAARQWQDAGDPRLLSDANILMTYTFSSRDILKQVNDPRLYQNYSVLVPNPYSGSSANPVCPGGPKPAATPVPLGSPLSDPFAAPGAPLPLPFPSLKPR